MSVTAIMLILLIIIINVAIIKIIIPFITDISILDTIVSTKSGITVNFSKSNRHCTSCIVLLVPLLEIGARLQKDFHQQLIVI
jgi:hypothetical protein